MRKNCATKEQIAPRSSFSAICCECALEAKRLKLHGFRDKSKAHGMKHINNMRRKVDNHEYLTLWCERSKIL
jgi:hypothetical protein